MKELFDVHCHMVPGVDDGAADLEESLAMLKMQHEDGVRKIISGVNFTRTWIFRISWKNGNM